MDILLAFIFGGALGAIAHAVMPGRDLRGVVLMPIIGALVGGIVWLVMTWLGQTTESVWIWLASVVVPAAVVFPATAVLTRIRAAHDEHAASQLRAS